ncbi:MAG: SpoIIIAH-like family protein [Evtepia gabavorous]
MNGREAMGRLAQRVKASMGRYRLVWLVILAGLILLLLPTGEKEGEAREETEQTQSAFDLAATEARLSQALSKIHGAGEVTVVLTVANGPRQILAENVDRDGSQGEEKTETVVLSRGSGSQETVTVQEIYPRYQGAAGLRRGDDPTVRLHSLPRPCRPYGEDRRIKFRSVKESEEKPMKLWKRNAIAAAIVLFVCGAVYLNWSYSQDTAAGKNLGEAALVGSQNDPLLEKQKEGAAAEEGAAGEEGAKTEEGAAAQEGADAESGTYFSTARLNRQQARDNALSLLQEAAEDEKADQSSVDQANAAIQTMADYTMTEAQIENLITAKGYTDCVAFLGEDSISVVVSAMENGMTDADAARIGEIVMEQTGLKADQIKIIEAE